MKLRALTNGNEYQTEDPHLAYPLYLTEEQAREWTAAGLLEEIKEPTPKAKPSRDYKRRDLTAENTAADTATQGNAAPPAEGDATP